MYPCQWLLLLLFYYFDSLMDVDFNEMLFLFSFFFFLYLFFFFFLYIFFFFSFGSFCVLFDFSFLFVLYICFDWKEKSAQCQEKRLDRCRKMLRFNEPLHHEKYLFMCFIGGKSCNELFFPFISSMSAQFSFNCLFFCINFY